jgi:hypothetical protein
MTDLIPPQPGDRAPAASALDARGEPVALETFWRDGPAVLVFLRHWG